MSLIEATYCSDCKIFTPGNVERCPVCAGAQEARQQRQPPIQRPVSETCCAERCYESARRENAQRGGSSCCSRLFKGLAIYVLFLIASGLIKTAVTGRVPSDSTLSPQPPTPQPPFSSPVYYGGANGESDSSQYAVTLEAKISKDAPPIKVADPQLLPSPDTEFRSGCVILPEANKRYGRFSLLHKDYHLRYQSDDNLVLYRAQPGHAERPIWASDTSKSALNGGDVTGLLRDSQGKWWIGGRQVKQETVSYYNALCIDDKGGLTFTSVDYKGGGAGAGGGEGGGEGGAKPRDAPETYGIALGQCGPRYQAHQAIAIGNSHYASNPQSVAIGWAAVASGTAGVAIGVDAVASSSAPPPCISFPAGTPLMHFELTSPLNEYVARFSATGPIKMYHAGKVQWQSTHEYTEISHDGHDLYYHIGVGIIVREPIREATQLCISSQGALELRSKDRNSQQVHEWGKTKMSE